LDLEITLLDVFCLILSYAAVAVYIISKSWLFNNILAILFCVSGMQYLFLGNFQTGFMLLGLLFFYDIFFVFGTDVMLTVAKSIDAPIKILFIKDWSAEPTPQFSLLGLGDIVIPGVFVSLCLRYDMLKALNTRRVNDMIEEDKGDEVLELMKSQLAKAPKTYYHGCLVGYLIAIIATVVVMLVFEHGQPALLYLVPGCLLSVLFNAWRLGELKEMWEFDEEPFYTSASDLKEKSS